MTVVVAGGGIAGLAFALTCHEIGVDVQVFEASPEIKPLGVGINLQPNAVRELIQLGLETDLREIGIEAEEWALYFYGAHPVWNEPRGTKAGYNWPQFSVHRGQFQLRLVQAVRERLGEQAVVTDARLTGYENTDAGVTAHFASASGAFSTEADLLVGADGIHSTARQQMHPDQGDVHWSGAIMWRGVSRYAPPRAKNSFVMIGGMAQRFICYPVEPLDDKGETMLNWIAELRPEDQQSVNQSDWNKPAQPEAFMSEFQDWTFDWINVPDIVGQADGIWEYPMVDRDPVDRWVDGRVVLIGDAAHAMYPHGSNGASQGIVDTRVLGKAIDRLGLSQDALLDYQARQLEPVNQLLLRARGEGPMGVLIDIEERLAQGRTLEQAIDQDEIARFMARYKEAAGFDRDALNAAPSIIRSRSS
jgi:2-polyprenyl-6-methoxyphenol hydroxylase-like FAD-dependent oxidoreductase